MKEYPKVESQIVDRWNADFHRNADAVWRPCDDGPTYFVKPMEVDEPFSDFIDYVRNQELSEEQLTSAGSVKYSQARKQRQSRADSLALMRVLEENDNLRGEYSDLRKDVAKDIPWARIALGQDPDAINLWIGNSRSVTALHKDNYENIYCQVIGSKYFVLLPPVETACVDERDLPSATYAVDDLSVRIPRLKKHRHELQQVDRCLELEALR